MSEAQYLEPVTIEGRHVTLVPLDPAAHAESLYEGSHGPDRERIWRYLWEGPFEDRAAFDASLREKTRSKERAYLAIVDRRSGAAVGHAAFMRAEPRHRVIEVGDVLYTTPFQRTVGATEAMYLMARHAFERLGVRRYEWKCDALNEPSRAAALRLGFVFEGIFRQHMIIKGRNRDTAWFSMLDIEWPARKAAFERWLAPDNFDDAGRQTRRLADFRE
ncbi:MAG TPA: GNAT family protein [Vicinamibacterales bacterium]|nr:GNAT family protein [Vicinamibacterales bacterium]